MQEQETITPKQLKDWEAQVEHIVTVLCETDGWSEDEFAIVYNEIVLDLRRAAVRLADLAHRRDNPEEA